MIIISICIVPEDRKRCCLLLLLLWCQENRQCHFASQGHLLHSHMIVETVSKFSFCISFFSRYHHQSGVYGDAGMSHYLDHHVAYGKCQPTPSFDDHLNQSNPDFPSFSLAKQQDIINSLPNNSGGQGRGGVRYTSYFSTGSRESITDTTPAKYQPTSIRNRVLFFWRLKNTCKIMDTLHGNNGSMKSMKRSHQAPTKTSQVDENSLVDQSPPPPFVPPLDIPTTPYTLYVENILGQHGVFQWRIHSDSCDVFALNDINISSAVFLKNDFVHVTRTVCQNDVSYFCSCKMSDTITRMNYPSKVCWHVRFCQENIDSNYQAALSGNQNNPVMRKISQSRQYQNKVVTKLGLNSRYCRFSVISADMSSCDIVHLEGSRFSCQNGQCRASKGHKRKIQVLGESTNCHHLLALHHNRKLWQHMVEQQVDEEQDPEEEPEEEQESDFSSQVCWYVCALWTASYQKFKPHFLTVVPFLPQALQKLAMSPCPPTS